MITPPTSSPFDRKALLLNTWNSISKKTNGGPCFYESIDFCLICQLGFLLCPCLLLINGFSVNL